MKPESSQSTEEQIKVSLSDPSCCKVEKFNTQSRCIQIDLDEEQLPKIVIAIFFQTKRTSGKYRRNPPNRRKIYIRGFLPIPDNLKSDILSGQPA